MDLKPGEVECGKCNGTGIVNASITIKRPYQIVDHISTTSTESLIGFKCPKCHGNGKLDWVENVTGKKVKGREFQ